MGHYVQKKDLQFDICGDNIPLRKHELNIIFCIGYIVLLFFCICMALKSNVHKHARKKNIMAEVVNILKNFYYKNPACG